MLVNDLIEKLENIKKQENALKEERKNIVYQAKRERVLEINVVDFAEKLKTVSQQENFKIAINKICIPTSLIGKMEEAKNYIISSNMGISIMIVTDFNIYKIKLPMADIKLQNGENLIDHLKFKEKEKLIYIPKNIVPQIMINIGLNDPCMEKLLIKHVVLECVKDKENKNQNNI